MVMTCRGVVDVKAAVSLRSGGSSACAAQVSKQRRRASLSADRARQVCQSGWRGSADVSMLFLAIAP